MTNEQELILLRKSILKELDGYRYIVYSLFKEEFFYTENEIKYHSDPVIRGLNPWPICDFINIKLKNYNNFNDELFDLLHLRENTKRFHLYEEPAKFKLTITTNFDARTIFSDIFNLYDSKLVQIDLINEYQFQCVINEQESYYALKTDIRDIVEDYFKPKRQKQFEMMIIENVNEILNNVHH